MVWYSSAKGLWVRKVMVWYSSAKGLWVRKVMVWYSSAGRMYGVFICVKEKSNAL